MTKEEQAYECLYGKELKKNKDSDVRGSLRLEASTSKPITSAGEEISIYVVIRNPFASYSWHFFWICKLEKVGKSMKKSDKKYDRR